jgi:hypothetical protein
MLHWKVPIRKAFSRQLTHPLLIRQEIFRTPHLVNNYKAMVLGKEEEYQRMAMTQLS